MIERDGIESTLEQVRPRIFRLCNRVLRHAEDAEDATQHVLLKVADRLRLTPDAPSIDGWLYRVTLTTSLELRRRGLRRTRHEQRKLEAGPIGTDEDPVWDGLHLAIADLNEDLRSLVVDYYFEKRTLDDLAKAGGCSTVAVWKKISKAREEIKDRLRKAGYGAAIPTPALEWLFRAESAAPPAGAIIGGTAMAAKHGTLGFTIAASMVFLVAGVTAGAVIANRRASREEEALREELSRTRGKLDQASRGAVRRPETAAADSSALSTTPTPAVVAPPVVPGPAASATFRDRLRRVVRQGLIARKTGRRDPAEMAELTPTLLEVFPVLQSPSKNPDKFAEFYQNLLEVAGEEVGTPFSESQKSRLAAVLDEVRRSFVENGSAAAPERRILDLQGKRRMVQGLVDLLSPSQAEDLPADLMDDHSAESAVYLAKEYAAADVVRSWTEAYELEEYQKPAAETAARSMIDSIKRLSDRFVAANGFAPEDLTVQKPAEQFRRMVQKLDYRIDAAAAQRDALKTLEGALSSEQRSLTRSKTMIDFHVSYSAPLEVRKR